MKRQKLKFRVYNKTRKRFCLDTEDGYVGTDEQFRDGTFTIGTWERNCVLQEYTGINDKNQKEIYEGDIITLWLGNYPTGSGTFEVTFKNGAFCLFPIKLGGIAGLHFPTLKMLNGVDKSGNEIWKENFKFAKPLYGFSSLVLEVIGNKFENKNLLK